MGKSHALEPDEGWTPTIKKHSLQKIRLHNYYAEMFSTSMKRKWPQRVYLGLFSGSGRAEIENTGQLVETTPIAAMRLRDPFTKYIFVDSDEKCTESLRNRIARIPGKHDVSLITGDVHDVLSKVHEAMPNAKHGSGLISLCFIDPFSADLRFDVIRNLAMHYKMDFLILLMLGRDIVTNFKQYYLSEGDERIARLIDDPEWRSEWRALGSGRKSLVRFILQKFDDAMVRIGYPARKPEESHSVKVYGKGVFLYSLVFYSKSKLGARFWKTATNNYGHQLALDIDP